MLTKEELEIKKNELVKYLDVMVKTDKAILNLFLDRDISEMEFYSRIKKSQETYMKFLIDLFKK